MDNFTQKVFDPKYNKIMKINEMDVGSLHEKRVKKVLEKYKKKNEVEPENNEDSYAITITQQVSEKIKNKNLLKILGVSIL